MTTSSKVNWHSFHCLLLLLHILYPLKVDRVINKGWFLLLLCFSSLFRVVLFDCLFFVVTHKCIFTLFNILFSLFLLPTFFHLSLHPTSFPNQILLKLMGLTLVGSKRPSTKEHALACNVIPTVPPF